MCDLYGTLFISGSGEVGSAVHSIQQEKALQELLAGYQLPFTPQQIQDCLHAEIKDDHRRAKAKGADFPEVCIDRLWQSILGWPDLEKVRVFAVEYEMIINPVWPMPGLEALLDHCRDFGIHLGIISNAQFFTPLLFEWFLDGDPAASGFDPRLIFFSYIHGLAKPSPHLFRMAESHLKQMHIPACQVAYIGNDMRNDIMAARTVNFQTILFAGDVRSLRLRTGDPVCRETSADLVITDLLELERYLH
jgi:putative hydrolase of the HAD superfamily